jgi:hypothetical protein
VRRFPSLTFVLLAAFSVLGFLVMGYHPGAEDDSVYVTAVNSDLNPALFPHDAGFFKLQLETTIFDTSMAAFVRATHMPVSWAELLWQAISLFLIVWACWAIVSQLFEHACERWAAIAMITAMFTLPVAGSRLFIADQYLHPRSISTALILFAVSRLLAGKRWQSVLFVVVAFLFHPLMGALGVSFCLMLTLTLSEPVRARLRLIREWLVPAAATPLTVAIPFGWMFSKPSEIWMDSVRSRHWYRLYQWTWYEWLGIVGPLVIFWVVRRVARRQGQFQLARLATAILIYGVFQQAVAMILLGPQELICLTTLEPMRYLHLIYVFMALVCGGYLGRLVLKQHIWRWAAFLLIANGPMFFVQRQLFAATEHLELPGRPTTNQWLQAFSWIRENTPVDAYFAIDPNYMAEPGEDYHSFRALAERSVLADAVKDTSVVTKVPELGPAWHDQVAAATGWPNFKLADFERLKGQFGVDWVLVSNQQTVGLACRWHDASLSVCQIP